MDFPEDRSTQVGDVFLLESAERAAGTLHAHEVATLHGIGYRIARVMGRRFMSWYRPHAGQTARPYCIPADTLVGDDGVPGAAASSRSILGGIVPFSFVASKVIVHPALDRSSIVPPGWSPALADTVANIVLPGFSVFSIADIREAVVRLLRKGPVRLKPAWARGGGGQSVIHDLAEAERAILDLDEARIASAGVVVESDLADPVTYSVGQMDCGDVALAYVGRQRQTRNRAGDEVYGGSDLWVIRGTLADLEGEVRSSELAQAVRQAREFDAAVAAAYPGFVATRRNYDLIAGRSVDGQGLSGVLEQSWRVGGATPAEVAALHVFAHDPRCDQVRTSSHEVYGESELPEGADIYYRGHDPVEGMMTKFSLVEHGRRGAPL